MEDNSSVSTLNLRCFSSPESLRSISPCLLLRLLQPYRGYFEQRDLDLPDPESTAPIAYDDLAEVLINPDRGTPAALIDALFFVTELATPDGMDSLLGEVRDRGLSLEHNVDDAPVDVAIRVWLLEPDILQEKHAEQYLVRPRSFEYYQTDRPTIPSFRLPSPHVRRALEESLDEWFVEHRRGAGTRVFVYPREHEVWFLVRHGNAFRREGSLDNGEPSSVAYRPLKFDVLVYDQRIGEIRMNAGSVGEKDLYRAQIGKHLFGSEDFFPGDAKYTLDALREDGVASLECDVDGIEWIILREVQFFWGGQFGEIEIRKASDVFGAFAARDRELPAGCRIFKAVFQVKFADCKSPRSVTIKTSNVAQYTRDHDSVLIEQWLAKRGFIIAREVPDDVVAEPVLAGV